jgi:mRNA interferase RelE/StbE
MSRYAVYITSHAWDEIKDIPGNIRQRIKRAIDELEENPHPSNSKQLELDEIDRQVCRIRLDKWRIVYMVDESEHTIDVLAIRKRPPYDYGDLTTLIES